MNKLLAIIKREYLERVRSKMFVVATLLGPLLLGLSAIGPTMFMRLKTGEATRLAVVDQTGTLGGRIAQEIENPSTGRSDSDEDEDVRQMAAGAQFRIEQVADATDATKFESLKSTLDKRVNRKELDAYLIVPPDVLQSNTVTYYARNTGDIFSASRVRNALNTAVSERRLTDAGINPAHIETLSKPIKMSRFNAVSDTEEKGAGFALPFGVGMLIYVLIAIYGSIILFAVVEEKSTRISEVLFSSANSFTLLLGKLIGVSLVALTQVAIWGIAVIALSLYAAANSNGSGALSHIPYISPVLLVYVLLFFLMGFFIYATLYALVGAAVTTTQEGQQLSTPIIMLLVASFLGAFSIIQSPNSAFSFWMSMIPFFSPIAMLIRIVTEQPPFWQIALSLFIGFATIILLTWLAARVYRIGMLMYGKRATIPEIMRWVRQS